MINSALNLIPTSGLIIILTILLILIVTTLKVRKKVKYWMFIGIILGASIAVAHVYHNTPPAQEAEPQQQYQQEADQELEPDPQEFEQEPDPQEFTVKSDLDLVGLGADSYTASGEPATVNNLATNGAGGPFATLTELLGNLEDRAKADFIETLKREVHVSDADIQRTLDLEVDNRVAKAILVNNQRISDEQARQIVVEKGLATEAEARIMKVVKVHGVRNSYLNKNKHIVFYEDHRSYVAVMICIMTGDNKAIPAIKTDCGNILKPVKEKEPKPVKIKKPEKAKKPQKGKKPKKGKKQPQPQPQPTPKKPSPTPKKPGVVIKPGGNTDLDPKSDNKNDYVYPKGKSNNNKIDPTQAEEKTPVLEDKDKAQPAPTPTPKEQENINQHNDAVNEAAPLPGGEDAPPNDSAISEPPNPNGGN